MNFTCKKRRKLSSKQSKRVYVLYGAIGHLKRSGLPFPTPSIQKSVNIEKKMSAIQLAPLQTKRAVRVSIRTFALARYNVRSLNATWRSAKQKRKRCSWCSASGGTRGTMPCTFCMRMEITQLHHAMHASIHEHQTN